MDLHELWQEFKDHAAQIARAHTNLSEEQIDRLTAALIDRMAALWGGMSIYFPRGDQAKISERDKAIIAAYDGKPETITALSRRHGLTEVHIYRIIGKQRNLRRQGQPPPTPPAKP